MSNLRSITKEQYYSIIKQWVREHNGRSPTKEDFNKDKNLPSPRTLEECLKIQWNKALKECGLEQIKDKTYYKMLNNKDLLEKFREEYTRLNYCSRTEFESNRNKSFPSLEYLEKRYKCKWNDLLRLAGIEEKDLHAVDLTKEEYIKLLKDTVKELKHIPSIPEFESLTGRSATAMIRRFNLKYNEIIKLADLQTDREKSEVKETDEELLQMYINYCKKIGKMASEVDLNNSSNIYGAGVFTQRFGGMRELKKLAGYEETHGQYNKFSKQKIIDLLIEKYKQYGRTLTYREIKEDTDLPGVTTICRRFKVTKMEKVWQEIIKLIGGNKNGRE